MESLYEDLDFDAYLDAKAQEEEEKNSFRNSCAFGEPIDWRDL